MSVRGLAVIAIVLGLAAVSPPAAAAAPLDSNATAPFTIEAVYPNPVADRDAGEFVVLRTREPISPGNWTLADDDGRARLPNVTATGRIAVSAEPAFARNNTDAPVRRIANDLALANGGETVVLFRNGTRVDAVSYERAPEGSIGRPADGAVDWHPVGATDFPVVRASGGRVQAFVVPDDASVPIDTLAAADSRVLLAGYTLTARRTTAALVDARRRGASVRVLLDGEPVGGLSRRSARRLDRLVDAGIEVTVLTGDPARYEYHHAKYAVVDDRALVTTENWKPAGTGGHSSRGWGAVLTQQPIVSALAATFQADAGWRDGVPWETYRADQSFPAPSSPPANGTYPRRFTPERLGVEGVSLLRAPDNAEARLVGLLENASASIRIQQVSIGSRRQPFLRAAIRAARRGVDVDVLLSSAWYVREDNRELVDWLDGLARREGLPLVAALADPQGRFEKIHAKGVVVDDAVVLGSLNWNNNSARSNREVALVLRGAAVSDYYRRVFRADWRGGVWRITVGIILVTVLGTLAAVSLAGRIAFAPAPPVDGRSPR